MVVADGGQKMTKSTGNSLSLLDLLDAYGRRAFRLQVLQSHYRAPIEVTDTSIGDAETVERIDSSLRRFPTAGPDAAVDDDIVKPLVEAMDDDPTIGAPLAGLRRRAPPTPRRRRARPTRIQAATVARLSAVFGSDARTGTTELDADTAAPWRNATPHAARTSPRPTQLKAKLENGGWVA